MVKFLSVEEKTEFLTDILNSVDAAELSGDWSIVTSCIQDWENIVELNSIPNFQVNVWNKFNKLKAEGKIS